MYQTVNTFRYETKHTRPLIRVREITTFKEAHTAHASKKEADIQVQEHIENYKEIFDTLGIPYTLTKRPEWDNSQGQTIQWHLMQLCLMEKPCKSVLSTI